MPLVAEVLSSAVILRPGCEQVRPRLRTRCRQRHPVRVSAVIPSYNNGRFVADAIRSVLEQTHPVHEVLVVDDGSTDDTREVVAAFGGAVRYFYRENRGPSATRNFGAREAAGDWLAFLDADDQWLPQKIALQCDALRRNPDAVLVYTGIIGVSPDGSIGTLSAHDPERLFPSLRYRNCLTGSCSAAMVRRDIFLAEGGFDESIRGSEDWDLWVRLARRFKFTAVSEPVTRIRVRVDSASYDHRHMMQYTRQILDRTLVSDLHGWRRAAWRRRIWSSELYGSAISSRAAGWSAERDLLIQSLLEWPSPFFLPKRWLSLARNLLHRR